MAQVLLEVYEAAVAQLNLTWSLWDNLMIGLPEIPSEASAPLHAKIGFVVPCRIPR
jgi:hypothetical protein